MSDRNQQFTPDPIAGWRFDEGQGPTAKEEVSGAYDTIHSALSKGRFQKPQDPAWRKGISGHALMFDGYSTYMMRPRAETSAPVDGLTIMA